MRRIMSNDYKLLMLVYGDSKTGKSFLANGAPGPRLVIDAEGGTRFLPGKKIIWDIEGGEKLPEGIDEDTSVVVYLRKYKTIETIYEMLDTAGHPFKSVVLDSISEIQQRCVDEIMAKNPNSEIMRTQDWGSLKSKVLKKIRDFRDLSFHQNGGINVIALAMSKTSQTDHGEEKHSPLMQGSVGDALPFHFDVVSYLYMRPDEDGKQQRILHFASSDKLDTGDRTNVLPVDMEDPTIDKIINTIEGALNG